MYAESNTGMQARLRCGVEQKVNGRCPDVIDDLSWRAIELDHYAPFVM